MQDVYRAEQHLDWLAKRQVQIVAFDHDIIARALGSLEFQAQRVVRTNVKGIGFAQSAVFPWKAEAPLPLLADGLGLGRPLLLADELSPYQQAGSQHGRDAHRGHYREPPFELLFPGSYAARVPGW